MFGLEECTHDHFLEPGNRGKLAQCHDACELPDVWPTTSKLQETGTVDRLCVCVCVCVCVCKRRKYKTWKKSEERERERERRRQKDSKQETQDVNCHVPKQNLAR